MQQRRNQITPFLFGILSVSLALSLFQSNAYADDLQFGFATADITPSKPLRLSGYASRKTPFEGIDEKLMVRAMAMRSGDAGELSIIVGVETIGFPATVTNEIIARIRMLGIPRERIAICMTHCHTAPHITPGINNLFAPPLNESEDAALRQYTEMVVDKTATAIENSILTLRPGKMSIATGKATFARNRRVLKDGIWAGFGENSNGPVDHSLPVIRITDLTGKKIRGLLFNYACHCTTFGGDYNRVNGDWAGYAAKYLEEANEGAFAICTIGCGADANPERNKDRALELAQLQGKQISDEVNRLLNSDGWIEIVDPPTASFGFAGLPVDRPGDEDLQLAMENSNPHTRQHAQFMMQTKSRMGRLPETIPMPIQVWKFGDEFAMVFLGGEVVVEYAARIKNELGQLSKLTPDQIWVAAYANDVFGYVASETMRSEGGYEVDFSMIYYLIPGRWSAGTEEVIIKRVKELFTGKKIATPLSVEDAVKTFSLPDGFQIFPIVSEPLVKDPINFAVDSKGRLWVVEMGDYPQGAPNHPSGKDFQGNGKPWDGPPGGRIKIIWDADFDGRYDTAKVFLDGLTFPTGVFPWKNGAIISGAPDIIFASDTDGDGKADEQEVLYTGFEEANPQHRVNGFTYGLDGWLYLSGGTNNKEIKCLKTGETVRLSGRDVRIHPETGAAEAVSGDSQYGRCQDEFGNWYGNTNSEPLFQLVIDDYFFARNPYVSSPSAKHFLTEPILNPVVFPTSRTLDRFNDLHTSNRFSSACSPYVFRNTTLGAELQSSALICEPVHNLVSRIKLGFDDVAVSGSRFPEEQDQEFLASTDNWFRPVRLTTGPDGGLWICDMYRHVIEHPEWIPEAWQASLDLYAGSDKGRIYCVTDGAQAINKHMDLSGFDVAELAFQLRSQNGWHRDIAQQLILERTTASKPESVDRLKAAIDEIRKIFTDPTLPTPIRIQAVWTYSLLPGNQEFDLSVLLADPDPQFVANSIRALQIDANAVFELLDSDSPTTFHPRVQLEIALAANQFAVRDKQRVLTALAKLNPEDKWIRAAILSSSVGVAGSVLAEVFKQVPDSSGRSELAIGLINTALAENAEQGFSKLAQLATPNKAHFEDWQLEVLAAGFDNLQKKGHPFHQLNQSSSELVSAIAVGQLAIEQALQIATNQTDSIPRRLVAIRLLSHSSQEPDSAATTLVSLLSPQTNLKLQSAAVDSLASLDQTDRLVHILPKCRPTIQNEIQSKLLARPKWAIALLNGIEQDVFSPGHLNPSTIQALLSNRDEEVKKMALRILGAHSSGYDRRSLVAAYSADPRNGQAELGEKIFRQHCASCHRHHGIGQDFGANLSSLEGKDDEYFVRAILDPNAAVEWKYKSYNVLTSDGRTFSGMLLEESATSLTLATADGKQETILLTEIEEMKNSSKSFMPEGFENAITPRQMADLLAFIQSKPATVGASPTR